VPTLEIHDKKPNPAFALGSSLRVDLRHLLDLLLPQSLQSDWIVTSVKFPNPGHTYFEATGQGGEQLEKLSESNSRISGAELAAIAAKTRQVIWGEFRGCFSKDTASWVIIRAVDSSFHEVTTEDESVLDTLRAAFKDVREGSEYFV
jgi:hypothetical protein